MESPDEIPIGGKGAYELPGDELPIKGGSYNIPENEKVEDEAPLAARGAYKLPEEELPEEQEKEETGPLEKRIDSKTWKTRCKAYEELTGILKSNPDGPYSDFSGGLVKYISDSNPGAQEKGLDLLAVYIQNQPEIVLAHCEGITKALIEKGMASAKPSIKTESSNLILDLFSVHRDNFEGFQQGLLSSLNNKNIKVQAAGITAVNSVIAAFGVKKLPFKPFLSSMEKFAGVSNPQVRGEALTFYKEVFKWVRDLIKPGVEKLKKPQQDELQKAFEEITEAAVPTRWLKHEEAQAKADLAVGKVSKPVDIYEMADAKDIFGKYGERWCNSVLAMEKWQEKKQALEELNKECDYPKLAEKSAVEIVTMVKRLINDSNVNVMLQAMKLVGLLAKGQRRYFDNYARQFLPVVLQKFKDKKTLVLQEAHSSLDNLMFSISLEQGLEDIKEALEDKTPSVKTNTCQWLERVYEAFPVAETRGVARQIATIAKKNTEDSTPEVRQCSFKMLAVLQNKCGDVIAPVLKDLPPAKMKKIEEAGGTAPKASAAESRAGAQEEVKSEKVPVQKVEKVPAQKIETQRAATTMKKRPAEATSAGPEKKTPAQKAPVQAEDDANNAISAEEAESIVSGFLPAEMLKQMKDNAWKEKQTGLLLLQEWIGENSEIVNAQNEAILRFVRSTVKDWKENNFNVVKAAIEIFKNVSENYTISKRAAASALNATALENFANVKLLEVYYSCIVSICAAVGPRFVVGLIVKNTSDCNKPKVVSECCASIGKIITDYGVHSINLKDVVDYAKVGVNGANAVIKKASQSLTLVIYSYIGDKLTPLLTDIKESTLKALQEEFAKTEIIKNPTFKLVKGEEPPKAGADPRKMLDDVFPRANIEKQVSPALLKKLSDANWKIRKEGLDDVEAILDSSGMRILPVGLESLVKAMVGRIADPNKSLVRQCLLLSGKFAAALGLESKNFARHLLPPIISCLADKQNLLRQDAMSALNKWAEEAGIDTIIMHSSAPLHIENPELRTELLGWLLEHKEAFRNNDMRPYIQGTLACLQDRSGPIRLKGESLFAEICECVGFDSFQPFLKDIKPAVMNTLNPIFDKYRHHKPVAGALNAEPESAGTSSKLPKGKDPLPSARSGSKESQRSKISMPGKAPSETDLKHLVKRPESRRSSQPSTELAITAVGHKSKRMEAEAKCKWAVDDIRPDYLEKLKEQMRTCVTPDLFSLLFHSDFKKQVEGLGFLTGIIGSQLREVIEVLDILFKWVWIRLQEATNTQLIKSILELLELLVNALHNEGYHLHDVEASLFLPMICEKSGQNNVQFKTTIRCIIHNTARIYPVDRVFAFVLIACNSKNTKSKVECLEELAELVKEYGVEICNPKDIKAIVKYVSSTDNNVRTAAVQSMGEIYRLTGDQLWPMVGQVPDKVKDLLEQRFKAVAGVSLSSAKRPPAKDANNSKIATPKNKSLATSFEASRSSTPLLTKEEPLEIKPEPVQERKHPEGRSIPRLDLKSASPPLELLSTKIPEESKIKLPDRRSRPVQDIPETPNSSMITKQPMQAPDKHFNNDEDLTFPNDSMLYEPTKDYLLHEPIKFDESSSELDKHIEVLRNGDMSSRVDALVAINDLVLNNLDSHKEELQRKANQLSDALTKVILITFDKPIAEIPLRFAKYFLNVVHKVCCTKTIMRELNENSLFALVEQILIRLLIDELETLGEKGEGELMLKTLNGTMLRILEHCRPTRIFVVLIRLLTKYKSGTTLQKMTGLIIRCLLKLTKIMASLIHQIEAEKLLVAMHEYLVQSKPCSPDDVGSKTLKTILAEVVKLQGAGIWQAYDEVKKHSTPDVLIEKWIKAMISSSAYSVNTVLSPKYKPADNALGDIFALIKQDYKTGIQKLMEYLEKNPTADLKQYLSSLSEELNKKVMDDINEAKQNKNNNEEPNPGTYNFQDFQKRLSMMKQRYGLSATNPPTELTTTLTDLKAKVNNVLKPAGTDHKNAVSEMRSRIQSFKNDSLK